MAKAKGKTTKTTAPKKEVVDLTDVSAPQMIFEAAKEVKKPELKQEDVDQETREWLAQGGRIQSKYQQLRANQNAKIIRDFIKGMRNRRKVWK